MSCTHTTNAIRNALITRYVERNQYLLAHEVGNDMGFGIKNYADVIAVSNWKSRGLHLLGFEIKASRADWLKELKSPNKAEAFQPYCAEWWIAAAAGIVKVEELPDGWGLLELTATGLRAKVPAKRNKTPEPCPWPIAVMIMRRMFEGRTNETMQRATELIREIRERADREVERRASWQTQEATKIIKRAEEIKAASGIDLLHGWTPATDIAESLKAAESIREAKQDAVRSRNLLRAVLREFDSALGPDDAEAEAA